MAEQEELYNLLDVWEGTKPGMPVDAGHSTKLRNTFKSANAFKNALRDDVDASLLSAGWRKCTMHQNRDTLTGFFQPVLDVIMKMVSKGKCVRLWSGDDGPAPPTGMREPPMKGDAFRLNEAEVVRELGPSAFVLGIHAYSDATHISKSGAYKLYPVRIRLINVVTDEVNFVTVAYIPVVRKLKEPGADEKARLRRNAVLQRVLYLAFRTAIGASHSGVSLVVGGRSLLAFSRLLLYLADIPEEKAMLCLKPGKCAHPCSSCEVRVNHTGTPDALTSNERNAIRMLTTYLEVAGHRQQHRGTRRRADLEARTSAKSAVPALARFEGLSTAPFLLYKLIGFDVLHVLDLGVTRTLVHRLVRVFPHMRKNNYLLCGTTAATFRIGNTRISHMGRRSLAPRLAPGFFVEEGQPQSTFTGFQQR
eukprot:contig_5175_g1155